MATAGWYDDPGGSGQLRWWDGSMWTTATATSRSTARPSVGTDGVGPQPVPDVAGWGPPRAPLRRSVLLALLGSLLVAGMGAAVFFVVGVTGGAEGFGPDVDVVPVGMTDDTPLPPGRVVEGRVPSDGTWQARIVTSGGRIVVDVRGLDGVDPVATLHDAGGGRVARNDDRSGGDRDRWGGRRLDSLIDVDVGPGTYVLQVRDFDNDAGRVQVRLHVLDGVTAD